MPVHDMTKAAGVIVGRSATGTDFHCDECGYGNVVYGGASILVHSARCSRAAGMPFVACRWTKCKAVLDPVRVAHGATACNERHKTAAWKIERRYGRHDAVVVSGRANGSQHRKKPSGAQVSWGKAVAAVAQGIAELEGWDPAGRRARGYAERMLRPALSDRQRAQLDARERSSE